MNKINNEANILNANKGLSGVNKQYAKKHGNRGKQLNPNQKDSLIVLIPNDAKVARAEHNGPETQFEYVSFRKEYLEKGFLQKIGAREIGIKEAKNRDIRFLDGSQTHGWGYIFVEFLKGDEELWTFKEAHELLIKCLYETVGNIYSDTLWLNGKPYKNHNYKEPEDEPLPYCPAIDGYHDFVG